MRVLVVGSTSVIGGAIRADLRDRGHEVVTAGRRHADLRWDLTDATPLDRVHSLGAVTAVINVAAATGGPGNDAARVNVDGACRVAELASTLGADQLIHVSTAYVGFPACYPGPPEYIRTKADGEAAVLDLASRRGLPLTVLRPTHVYDDQGRCRRHQELLYSFADRASGGQDIDVHGTGGSRRDFLHVDDLVTAVRRCLALRPEATLTLTSPASHTILEAARTTLEVFASAGRVRMRPELPDPPGMPPVDDTGWRQIGTPPAIDLASGLARIAAVRIR